MASSWSRPETPGFGIRDWRFVKSETSGAAPGARQGDATRAPESPIPNPESRHFQSRQLEHLRRVWQTLGRDDPMWAVLSHADKRGGRWDPEEFLATGEVEVD